MRRRAIALLALGCAVYLAAIGVLWVGQERLLFRPQPLPATQAIAREPDVAERWVEVPGVRLSVLELRLPDPKGVVFFLHGNGGNLATWFVNTGFYRRANFDLVMFDYRGYGKSSGHIESQSQLQSDVLAVWQQIAPRYRGRKVVFYGRSLGTGLAAELAASLATTAPPDLTILVSPYVSMVELAHEHYPWVPSPVLRYPLRTDEAVARIRSPLMLIHGDHDALIPLRHSQSLQSLAADARLVVVEGAAHDDLQDFESYRQAVAAALRGS